MNILMIGAHPDDCDILASGLALKYVCDGHRVRFLSMTDGSAGHHILNREETAARRLEETREVSKLTGIEYDVWDVPDGQLMPDLATRERLIRYIRGFAPDAVFCHRPNDYHPDHRNSGLLVQDASYMLIVPNCVPDAPAMKRPPVIMFMEDRFLNPPFHADVVIDVDDVIEDKFRILDKHVSQFYEWLPYTRGQLESVPDDPAARFDWLHRDYVTHETTDDQLLMGSMTGYAVRFSKPAAKHRSALVCRYGERGHSIRFAEAYEVSEYGASLTKELREKLFPY